jgi:hypothetical protein
MAGLVQDYTSLEDVQGRIDHLNKEMGELFAAHPKYDFNGDQVKAIREAHKELNALGEKRDSLLEDRNAVQAMAARIAGDRQVKHEDDTPSRGPIYGSKGALAKTEGVPMWRKSLGRQVAESEAIKGYRSGMKEGPSSELDIAWILANNPAMAPYELQDSKEFNEVKTLLDTTAYPASALTTMLPGIPVTQNFRTPMVQQMIPSARTTSPVISYLRETTATSGAAAVAEGAAKPESALAFSDATSNVRKLATVLPITDEALADFPGVQGYIDNRLRLFLNLEWERQLLLGSGVSPNLTGILNTAGIQTQAKGADPTPDAFYKAIQKIRTVGFLEPNAIVMHPDDWTDIRLLRTPDGVYIWGSPQEEGTERLWSLPVRLTALMTQNTGLVGAFDSAAQQFIRQGVAFAMSTEHSDFFVTNKVMLRVEMRLALIVFRPAGFCTVTGI